MTPELWLSHSEFPRYEVSNQGRVRNLHGGRRFPVGHIHVGQLDQFGYPVVLLRIDGKRKMVKVHRMVVNAFLESIPPEKQVNHKNGQKADNRLENLEIVTPSQNVRHAFDVLGRVVIQKNPARGEAHGNARWKNRQIRRIRALYEQGVTQKEIARRFKTRQGAISRIVRRTAWDHVI